MMPQRPRRRKVAIVTGTRAEWGLLEPIVHAVADHADLEPAVIVAGLHLVSGTGRQVRAAGYGVAARVAMQKRSDAPGRAADVAAVGRGVSGFGRAFEKIGPDVVLVLGDRIEAFAAATAASVGGWPLAHVHGGDRAEGVADEAMRHAVTKLAHLHFPATAESARRIVRMGEAKDRVHTVGSPAVDGLADVQATKDAPELLVLQHPVGASAEDEERWMRGTLRATAGRSRQVLVPNRDAGAEGIRRAIEAAGVEVVEHLPRARWLSLLAGAKALVGNSSAGLIEAAVLRTACVNVGPRQAGRQRAGNVVDCDYGVRNVAAAIRRAEQLDLRRLRHPYGRPGAGGRIARILAACELNAATLRKRNSY